jgi:hypothetical protein
VPARDLFAESSVREACVTGGRGEQKPALQGAGGDFDEGVLGNEAQRSHTLLSVKSRQSCLLLAQTSARTDLWHRSLGTDRLWTLSDET